MNIPQHTYQLRTRHIIENRNNTHVIINGESLVNFCSSDYLNIATHPNVKKAFIQAANQYGLGSGSSALISGYSKAHHLLEETFAEFLNRERALLFNSGYHANLAVVTTFANKNSKIIADKFCHASLIDGIQLSRAKCYRYPHQDLIQAETLVRNNQNALLITESVFSMQGSITNIKKLAELSLRYHATLIVDDAHGVGVLGKHGKGICEYYQLSQQDIPCLITPLGKSVGSLGAIVTGSNDFIETLLQTARTYRYSTSLPPAICAASSMAIKIIAGESWRREKLLELIRLFHKECKARELPLINFDETPIKSIAISTNKIALELHNDLMQNGYFVSCIRPPTASTPRIRISLTCEHTEKQIISLLDNFKKYYDVRIKNHNEHKRKD